MPQDSIFLEMLWLFWLMHFPVDYDRTLTLLPEVVGYSEMMRGQLSHVSVYCLQESVFVNWFGSD